MLNLECGYETRGYFCCGRLLEPLSVLGAKFGLKRQRQSMGATAGAFGVRLRGPPLVDDVMDPPGGVGGGGVGGTHSLCL